MNTWKATVHGAAPEHRVTRAAAWLAGTWWQRLACTLGIAALYVLTARIGQPLALPPGNVTPVWLPSGIMFALAVLWGPRVAPGVFLGAFAGNAWACFSVDSLSTTLRALAAGTSNGLGDVLATVGMALLLQRLRGTDRFFDRAGDVAAFVLVGAGLGGLISAVFGVGTLLGLGFLPADAAPVAFLTWWTGDGVGVVLLAPMMMVWRDGVPDLWTRRDRQVAAAVVLGALLLPSIGFGLIPVPDSVVMGSIIAAPVLLWTALDLGRRLSYLTLAIVGGMALLATALGLGPFSGDGPGTLLHGTTNTALVSLQLFLAGLSTTIMLLSIIATQRAAARAELERANVALAAQSRTDALTGLANRLRLQERLADALVQAGRQGDGLAVLMADIDGFKAINDTHGHNVGDTVLIAIAETLRDGVRGVDLAGRWGGEEFLVVLDRCNGEQAGGIAEDLRARIADRVHPGVGQVTISIGVAAFRPDDTQDSLVSRADRALYAAKHGGRNQVAVEQAVG